MASSKTMSVQVKTGQLRATPSFMGKIIANLNYGDQVDVRGEQSGWIKAALKGKSQEGPEGWIHSSALTTKRIILQAGAEDVEKAATSDELALAGKGFNEQVEGEFRAKNKDIDFAWIDKMEQQSVSPAQVQAFIQQGELRPEGGRP